MKSIEDHFKIRKHPTTYTFFPYTTLFRSDRFVIVSIFIPKLRLILILNSFFGSSDILVFSELFRIRMSRNFGMKTGRAGQKECRDRSRMTPSNCNKEYNKQTSSELAQLAS